MTDAVDKVGDEQRAGNNRIQLPRSLNQCCAPDSYLETMLLTCPSKNVYRQHRPKADNCEPSRRPVRAAITSALSLGTAVEAIARKMRLAGFMFPKVKQRKSSRLFYPNEIQLKCGCGTLIFKFTAKAA
jgi:hypothetical protein